jgi:DNA-binding transcriptional ArsR family regulator
VLGDATRLSILRTLIDSGPLTVGELVERIHSSQPNVSKHLKVLQRAGFVTQGRKAQWRPCRLEAAPLREVADWVERYRRIWDERYEQLDAYLLELQDKERDRERKP